MVIPVYLAEGFEFKTKTAAKKFFKSILNSYDDGDFISNPQHHTALLALLSNHPEATIKIGEGVKEFDRDRAPDHKTSCFYITRIDGSRTDFSYPTAINGALNPGQVDLRNACHNAVEQKINAIRKRFLSASNPRSEVSGVILDASNCHVLHKDPTFGMLVSEFRNQRGWADGVPEDVFTKGRDFQSKTQFVDPQHSIAFNQLYDEKARVIMVSAEESRTYWRG